MSLLVSSVKYIGDGSESAFTLTSPASNSTNILVIVNGLVQMPDVDYTIADSIAYLNIVPIDGADVEIREYSSDSVGFRGSQGIPGDQGEVGYTGSVGVGGEGGGSGTLSLVMSESVPFPASSNTLWWNTGTGVLYVYYQDGTSEQWVTASPSCGGGDPGTGELGYTGSIGFTGSAGAGYTGSSGTIGYDGSVGSIGYAGSRGLQGVAGAQGPQGVPGTVGFVGSSGAGYTGSQGLSGAASAAGYAGSKGDSGFAGSIGIQGTQGAQGFHGSRGDKGTTGNIGPSGPAGFTGSKGDSGSGDDFTSACSGAVTRTYLAKARDFVNVLDFGADPTGSSDSTTAFQNAMNCLGLLGGTVYVPQGKFLILNNLSVGSITSTGAFNAVTIQGPHSSSNRSQSVDNIAALSAIILSPSATIRLFGGSGIEGCNIIRQGFVQNTTAPASYAGTAIFTNYSYGTLIRDCMIIGFNQAISADQVGQVKVTDVYIDCTNGVLVNNSVDVTYLTRVHCWPFVTESLGSDRVKNRRTGTAFHLTGINDWTKLTDCFVYGYFRGYRFSGGDECMATGCGSDNTYPDVHPGSIGFLVESSATNVHLNNCQAAASQNGFYFNNSAHVQVNQCAAWGLNDNGYVVLGGAVSFVNSSARGTPTGINIGGGVARGIGFGTRGVATPVRGTLQPMGTTFTF